MKNEVLKYWNCTQLLCCLVFLLYGCSVDSEFSLYIRDVVNVPADLTVTNLTTGESCQKKSTIEIGGDPYDMVFHHGERMQLLFSPPDKYKKEDFLVTYKILDIDTIISKSSYLFELTIDNEVPIGSYPISCSAMCDEWADNSSCVQTVLIRIE